MAELDQEKIEILNALVDIPDGTLDAVGKMGAPISGGGRMQSKTMNGGCLIK
jgi:hypothetical protein